MDLNHLHFAYPLWLLISLAIPIVWMVYFLCDRKSRSFHQLEKFIDKHLLPYLLVNQSTKTHSLWKTLVVWSIVWSCLTVALAGPRWSFREMETFSRDQSLVILLDLSESMNATDVKPSRLIRAKQKIEDLLNLSQGVKIGLIAFAADAHMITPITDDKETIRHLLPSLATDLVYVQGSRLSPALTMASMILETEPGTNKAILVISDGGFEDASAIVTAKQIAEKGVVIHAMGVGTTQGAPLHRDHNVILSKLEKERLSEISKAGHGRYLEVHYSNFEESAILKELENNAEAQMNVGKKNQFWDEHFYLFILPVIPFILWWFGRGYIFAAFLFLCSPTIGDGYFKNSEELGKEAFDADDYETASKVFQDPYRKGVAYYKAGNFAEAEKIFQSCQRPEMACSAAYNLGNALAQQQKLKEAIKAYEEALKICPDHLQAKENLEIVKKMLEQQQKNDNESSDGDDQQEKQNDDQEKSENGNSNDQQQEKKQDSEEKQQEEKTPPEEQQEPEQQEAPQQNAQEDEQSKSQEDQDADLWLNRITNDPATFLKNKFYLESKKNGTKEGIDPW